MTSWISHSGAPGWITARLDFTMFIRHRPCKFFPLSGGGGGGGGGMVFIIIVITELDWQQTVCLFSYYPIQLAIHYKAISKNTPACWDPGLPGQLRDETLSRLLF